MRRLIPLMFVLVAIPAVAGLEDGLVAYYPFNGNAIDESGRGNDGVVNGATLTEDRFGEVDSAYYFDGQSNIVTANPFGVTGLVVQPFTVSVWIKTDVTTFSNHIVSQWYDCGRNPRHFHLKLQDGQIKGEVFSVAYVTTSNGIVTDNEWHQLVLWRSTTEARLYVDGDLLSTDPSRLPSILDIRGPITIGSTESDDHCDSNFIGAIDDVRVYDRALSDQELGELFCVDSDGDGYCVPDDCDDDDPAVNPGAVEYPGNFVDEDCNGDLGDCDPCFVWRNHGEYVRCTSREAEALVESGDVTPEQADQLVSDAARSDIGKKGYTPPACR